MSPQPFAILQWSGLIALAVALFILMRTRWGQAKPLSKCIALSIFAHVLLVIYAHGTKLILSVPAGPPDPFIRVSMISTESFLERPDAEDAEPWNEISSELVPPPLTEPLGRQLPDFESDSPSPVEVFPELTPARTTTDSAAGISQLVPDPVSMAIPPEPIADLVAEPPLALDIDETTTESDPVPVPPEPQELVNDQTPDSVEPLNGENRLVEEVAADAVASQLGELTATRPEEAIEPTVEIPVAVIDVAPTPDSDSTVRDTPSTRSQPETQSQSQSRSPRDRNTSSASAEPPQRAGDGEPVPVLYALRESTDRATVVDRFGGSAETEAAVAAGLRWLVENQHSDGHWNAAQFGAGRETRVLGHDRRGAGTAADTGITGLALLALQANGNSHFTGTHRLQVQRGLEYLLGQQQADGSLAGGASLFARMYCHGIASLAISEAYAMTGDQRLAPYVQRAIGYTVLSQHATSGGWRYQPGDRGDMSQFGWQVMALKSAELGGIPITGKTRGGMLRFLAESTSGVHGGLASYRGGERVTAVMTAEALICRFFLGTQHGSAAVGEARELLLRELPGRGTANFYYWYYGTLAMFQLQGDAWQRWNEALQGQLLPRQRTGGELAGSWDPDTVWGGYGGRVYSTAMAVLCLEVYYRYLPLYEIERSR